MRVLIQKSGARFVYICKFSIEIAIVDIIVGVMCAFVFAFGFNIYFRP